MRHIRHLRPDLRRAAQVAAMFAAAALTGCAVGPNYHTPAMHTPAQFAAAPGAAPNTAGPSTAPATPVDLARWWQALGDPELDSLIERAVRDNPDVLIALDRLQAARTYEASLVGAVLPAAAASAGGGRGTGSDLARGRASQGLVSAENGAGFQRVTALAGFDAIWEIDLFGKFRREIEAARYDAQASAAARNAVLVSVIADVARAYVDLRGLQTRAAVLHAAIGVLSESLRIVRIRYERGITNELDVTLAARELASLQAQVAPVDAELKAAQYALATLLGLYPEDLIRELSPRAMVPSVPSAVQTGLPLDLLRRRPDVQQAERELAASNARIGVAVGDLFPAFAVTGSAGRQYQGFGVTPAMSTHIWSAGAGVFWPLLDFGQLDAQVQIADLQTRALLVSYKRTIQDAVQQVDTTADGFGAQQVSLTSLGDALVASRRAVTLANERYERGLTDYLNVVDAERAEYTIEVQYTETQVALDEQFIALYRALGGGWQDYQQLPPIRHPLPAVLAIFRDTLAEHPLREAP